METIQYTTSYPEQELDLSCLYLDMQNIPSEEKSPVRTRSELYLPTLYFPSVDPTQPSWARTLGAKTFVCWLELHTLVNHENGWNQDGRVELSLEYTMNVLQMAKSTFYRTVIHPLWNYGLIDIVESEYEKNGTKALNLIVYPYPLNDRALAMQPLKQLRNYKTDYKSKSKHFGEIGAQVRYIQQQMDLDALAMNDSAIYPEEAIADAAIALHENLTAEQEALSNPSPEIPENGFSMPDSRVSILQPKYSTTNIIFKSSDFKYLTISRSNQIYSNIITNSMQALADHVLINKDSDCLISFVDYLFNKDFSIEFIADLFDILIVYCTTETKLLKYFNTIKFDIERGVNIFDARLYVRKIYDAAQYIN